MPLIKPARGTLLNKSHPLARGLVGCWLMNEGTGSKVFDLSGNGNTGTYAAGTASPSWTAGKLGSAVSFDGGDYIDCGSGNLLDTSIKTISFLMKGTFANYTRLIAAPSGFTNDYQVVLGSGGAINLTRGGGTYNSKRIASLSNNVWYHVVIVDSGTLASIIFYVNGQVVSSVTNPADFDCIAGNFLLGCRQDSSNYYTGILDHVMLFNRALSASEIALLYREPFCMFARAWRPELIGGQIVNLAGTSTALSSLSTTAKVLRKIAGTAAGTSNTTAVLSSIRGLLPEMERSWLAEALFNGMSSNAFKLGTTLSMGWFWTRVAGCSVLYRGSSMGEIDFAKVLAVSERDASEVSPPSYLSHYGGADGTSTYFYVIRRFNSCGCQERTLAAAVKVSIESSGDLAEPGPNNISSSKVKQVHSNKIRLVWFYCPLEQKSQPVSFNVYYDDRTGQIDYQNPLASIGYKGRKFYSFQSDELDSGRYLFAIRAEGPEGLENSSLAQLKIELNTTSLDVINILSAEAV